ncbi:hypothetical protein AB205_0082760 [Aquarana catesbeiana]|uniref:Uncharacterized protein n=1 Tax=Aquarana catesbeiana TaxID=8400 RepID=A0A2G9SGK9_AQUCT|nr:hypothetical protein AB205_0082760 [Aquarana catesbeiana]
MFFKKKMSVTGNVLNGRTLNRDYQCCLDFLECRYWVANILLPVRPLIRSFHSSLAARIYFVRAKEDAAPVRAHGALCSQSPGKNYEALVQSPSLLVIM